MHKLSTLLLLTYVTQCSLHEASAHELSNYAKSLDELERIIATDVQAGRMPRQSDQRTGELLDTLTDAKRYLENERYSLEDVRALTIACNRTDEIYKKYVLFGVQDPISTLRAPHLASKETQEAVLRNMRTFQPELTRLEVFSLQCKATLIPYARDMAAIVAQTQEPEAIRESIHQVRRGSYGAYAGTLIKAAEETLPIQYRLQLAAVLSDTASVYSDIFTPDLREAIVRRLTTQIASTSNDELRMSFAHIIQVMSASQCEGLCKY